MSNGVGFSAADGQFGHALVDLPAASWTREVTRDCWELLQRYWAQLEDLGIAFDDLPVPDDYSNKHVTVDSAMGPRRTTKGRAEVLGFARANRSGHIAMIRVEAGEAYVDSARNQKLIEAVKAIPGRRWLGNPPLWVVPIRSVDVAEALIDLAERFEMVAPDNFADSLRAFVQKTGTASEPVGLALADDEESIIIRTGFTPGAFDAMKQITGATYDKEANLWRVALSKSSWAAVSSIAGELSLPIDEGLQRRVEEMFAEAIRAYHEAVALEPSGRITAIPGMADVPGKPFAPAQWAGVEYIVDHDSGCLVADQPGVAKTAMSYAALAYLGRKRIVWICPAIAKEKMQREAEAFFPSWQTAIIDGKSAPKGKEALESLAGADTALVILNYEILTVHAEAISDWAPDALVCDEAHRMKEAGVSWTKAVKGEPAKKDKPARDGLADQVRGRGGSVLLLTGTPMPSAARELITLLQIADRLEEVGGWLHYARRYCGAYRDTIKGRSHWVMKKSQNLGELNILLRQHGMLRRRLAEVCPDLECLPPEIVEVELDPTYLADYREAERDIASYMAREAARLAKNLGKDPRAAAVRARLKIQMAEDAVELAVLRRLIGMAKLPGAIAWAHEWLELNAGTAMAELDGEVNPAPAKLAVAGYHKDVVEALHKELGGVVIHGGETRPARDKARYAFQDDPSVRVIVCSILAAGEAIELTAAHTTLTVEYDWVPKTHDQWVGRLYRRGQPMPVRPVYAHAPDTTDDVQRGVLDSKGRASDHAIDGFAPKGQEEFMDIEARMMDALIAIGQRGTN